MRPDPQEILGLTMVFMTYFCAMFQMLTDARTYLLRHHTLVPAIFLLSCICV